MTILWLFLGVGQAVICVCGSGACLLKGVGRCRLSSSYDEHNECEEPKEQSIQRRDIEKAAIGEEDSW